MNKDLTSVQDWSEMSQQDKQTMRDNWNNETNVETLQKSGQSIQNRACYEYYRRRLIQTKSLVQKWIAGNSIENVSKC